MKNLFLPVPALAYKDKHLPSMDGRLELEHLGSCLPDHDLDLAYHPKS